MYLLLVPPNKLLTPLRLCAYEKDINILILYNNSNVHYIDYIVRFYFIT